jgi:hypothetical protein
MPSASLPWLPSKPTGRWTSLLRRCTSAAVPTGLGAPKPTGQILRREATPREANPMILRSDGYIGNPCVGYGGQKIFCNRSLQFKVPLREVVWVILGHFERLSSLVVVAVGMWATRLRCPSCPQRCRRHRLLDQQNDDRASCVEAAPARMRDVARKGVLSATGSAACR